MRFLTSCILASTLCTAATAQDQPNTILVMDGSGSMWGQIDEVAKITIARDVVAGLLADFPAEQGLGLTVYGHRERGNCSDIETIVAPAPGTAGSIVDAVNGIKPLGRTPMTDAVIAAAEALRYTENAATVILVSDGVETCNPDPCAAARALEEAGINFTAHVVGFDVSDPEALAQMQCIAEETGGQFLTASNATELDLAMAAVVIEPEPIIVTGMFEAKIGDNAGPRVEDPITWDISNETDVIADDAEGNPFSTELAEGSYTATAYRFVDEAEVETTFEVSGANDVAVTVIFPEIEQTATLVAPETAVAGSTINVEWTGPENDGDQIITTDAGQTRTLTFAQVDAGNPAALQMPATEGIYDIHYLRREGTNTFLATTQINVTPVTATITAPDSGTVGETIDVEWAGPDYDGDMIVMAQDGGSSTISPKMTAAGNPIAFTLPATPGTYTINYRMRQGGTIIGSKTIEVTEVQVGLTAPDTAIIGETITVEWIGPGYDRDFIAIGFEGENHNNYTYTAQGTPLALLMPTEPGDYEIRYVLNEDREILATRPITLSAAPAELSAPETATAGSEIEVEWTGPSYDRDLISIGKIGENYENYTYVAEGSPLLLMMPTEPGDYELRYQLGQDRKTIATRMITVTDVGASISAPETATAGSTITVDWTGPDYSRDFVSIGLPGENYANYTYTREGSPLELQLPSDPGDYELRYQLGQDREVIATRMITLTEVAAGISAPDTAVAGDTIMVDWTGPNYSRDFISIGLPGENYANYTYTREGSPLGLQLPTEPGAYELRYQLGQDREVIATRMITLTEVAASISAPDTAVAGDTITVNWTGPDYTRDFISIGLSGENYNSYTYTNEGSPLELQLPTAPGEYELRYQLAQDREVIATRMITVTEVNAQLVAPDSIRIGEELIVGWDGPDYTRDFIGIAVVGADSYDDYTYTNQGNPLTVETPEVAGDYELRYFLGQDRTVIGTRRITVTE